MIRSNKIFSIASTILLLLGLLSCGKDNKIVKNGGNTLPPTTQIPNVPGVSPGTSTNPIANELQYIETIKAQRNCQRLPDITYSVSAGNLNFTTSRSTITGQLVQGSSPGVASRVFGGISTWGDVVTVIRRQNGQVITGHDLTFSFCINPSEGLFLAGRPIAVRQINQLVIDDQANCAVGNVDAGIFQIEFGQFSYNGTQLSAVVMGNPGLRFSKICQ
jgi:hypothetical protein